MYRSHNRKIRLERTGPGYELFWIAANAQHIIDRESHHSHQISLLEIEQRAHTAYFIRDKKYQTPEPHDRALGFFAFRKHYYVILAYVTELYGRRCVVESCHVFSDVVLLTWCRRNPDLVPPPDAT